MSKEFFEKVDEMFEKNLAYEEKAVIRLQNTKDGKILENINYSRLRFDSDFNMYKSQEDGTWVQVITEDYKPIIVVKEKSPK